MRFLINKRVNEERRLIMKTRIRAISILAVLAFVLAVNPMVYAKGTELTYEEMVVKCEWNEGQEAYGAGSSGGPVYAGHVFHGTYTGSNSTGGNFWFSPIDAVPGFSIKTTA